MTAGVALNNHFKTQAELTDIAGLSLDKLKKHYKNVSQELKDVNKELAEGETWWHKFGFGSVKGLEKQAKELEKVKKELEGQLSVKKEVIKAKEEEVVVDKKAYDLAQEMRRMQTLQISPMLKERAQEKLAIAKKLHEDNIALSREHARELIQIGKDEVAQTLANLKSQKEAMFAWMAEKRSMNDSGMERLKEDYERQKQMVDEAYMGELENKELHTANMLKVDKEYERAKILLMFERNAQAIELANQLGQELYRQGLIGFDAMRGIAVAQALISAQLAALKALETLPPPYSYAVAGMSYAMGLLRVREIQSMSPKREAGGPVSRGKSFLVGERGPELFTPNQSGNISSNANSVGSANVTFNIQANDTRGFDQLLQQRRGMIVGMINRAMRSQARGGLI
jgi:hypothetical protein